MCSAPHEIWRRVELPPEPHLRLIFQTVLRSAAWEPEERLPSKQVCFRMNLKGSNGSLSHPSRLPPAIVLICLVRSENILLLARLALRVFQHGRPNNIIFGATLRRGSGALSGTHAGEGGITQVKGTVSHGAGEPSLSVACTPATA